MEDNKTRTKQNKKIKAELAIMEDLEIVKAENTLLKLQLAKAERLTRGARARW